MKTLAWVNQEGSSLAAEGELCAGRIEGLDDETCERLVEQGVRTFRSLVELTSLSLARRTGISYTKLLDLSNQARRFMAEQPGEPANTLSDELEFTGVEGTPLRAGLIEGLDDETCERLGEQGVRTFRSLIELTSLSLARRSGIPYTKLLDLSYQVLRFPGERLLPKLPAGSAPRLGAVELRPEPHRAPSLEGLSLALGRSAPLSSPSRRAREKP